MTDDLIFLANDALFESTEDLGLIIENSVRDVDELFPRFNCSKDPSGLLTPLHQINVMFFVYACFKHSSQGLKAYIEANQKIINQRLVEDNTLRRKVVAKACLLDCGWLSEKFKALVKSNLASFFGAFTQLNVQEHQVDEGSEVMRFWDKEHVLRFLIHSWKVRSTLLLHLFSKK